MVDTADGTPKIDTRSVNHALKGLTGTVSGLATTFMLTKPSITSVANNFGSFGKKVGAITGVLEAQTAQYQSLTKSGVHFNGNLAQLTLSSTAAGLSVKEMAKLVGSNSEALAGFGASAGDGLQQFLKNLTVMRTDGNKYGMQLRNLGMTHEEIGEAMIEVQRMDMMSGRKRGAGDATIQEATAKYAKDLDLLAKLTGKNADELKKSQAAMARQGDFKAMQLGMSQDMSNAIIQAGSQADSSGYGDLFKDMMIRGFPSKDQAALAGTMGNTMRVMTQMHAATKAGDHKKLAALKKDLLVAGMMDKMKNKELAQLGGTTKVTAAVADVMAKTSDFEMAMMAKLTAKKGQVTSAQYAQAEAEVKAAIAKTKQEQADQGGEATKTTPVPKDRAVLDGVLRGQEAMIDGAVKTQKLITEKLYNEALGPMMQTIKTDSKLMSTATNEAAAGLSYIARLLPTGTSVTDGENATPADGSDMIAKLTQFQKKTDTSSGDGAEASRLKTEITSAGDDEARLVFIRLANKLLNIPTPTVGPTPTNPQPVPGVVNSHARGTPGIDNAVSGLTSFASITKDFGKESLALLHGNELVMTKAQAEQLDLGILALSKNMSGALAQMGTALSDNSTQKRNFPTFDLANMGSSDSTQKRNFPTQDEARALEIKESLKNKPMGELNKLANMGSSSGFAEMNSSRPEGAMRQGAINTIRSKDTSPVSNDTSELEAMFKQMITGELIPSLATMTASLPSSEVFGSLLETSKQQLGSTMQQLSKLDSGNKLTKRLSKAGNAFGGGLS
jgi:hypothetical protein